MVLELQQIVFSLKDRVKQQALSENSSHSLKDRVLIYRQLDLVDSCFSFFGFEITASTLMAKNLLYVSDPLPRGMPADHLNAFGVPYLLSQITAKHLNLPAKEPRARSNCLP